MLLEFKISNPEASTLDCRPQSGRDLVCPDSTYLWPSTVPGKNQVSTQFYQKDIEQSLALNRDQIHHQKVPEDVTWDSDKIWN